MSFPIEDGKRTLVLPFIPVSTIYIIQALFVCGKQRLENRMVFGKARQMGVRCGVLLHENVYALQFRDCVYVSYSIMLLLIPLSSTQHILELQVSPTVPFRMRAIARSERGVKVHRKGVGWLGFDQCSGSRRDKKSKISYLTEPGP